MNQEMHPYKDYGDIKDDKERYYLTLERTPLSLSGKALDLGVENPFSPILKDRFPDLEITNTDADLDLDSMKLPYKDNSFNYIFSFEVIEHLMNPLWNLLECRRILRDDGCILLTTPKGVFPSFMWMDTHFHEIDESRMRNLVKRANLQIVKFDRFNKSPAYWLKMGLIRPTLRILVGGWFYIELEKNSIEGKSQ